MIPRRGISKTKDIMASYSAEGLSPEHLSDAVVQPKENLLKKAMVDHKSMERRIRLERKNWYVSSSADTDSVLEAAKKEDYRRSEYNYVTDLSNQLEVLGTSNYGARRGEVTQAEGTDRAQKWEVEKKKMDEVLLEDENYRMYYEVHRNYHKTRLVLADKTYKLMDKFIKYEISDTFETRSVLQEKVKNHKKETDDLNDRVKELEEQLDQQAKARVLNLEKEKEENANRVDPTDVAEALGTENEKLKEEVNTLKIMVKNLKKILKALKTDLESAEARADSLEESQHCKKPAALTTLNPQGNFAVAPHTQQQEVDLTADENPNKKRKSP